LGEQRGWIGCSHSKISQVMTLVTGASCTNR
jgi:hypothetical protein